MVNYLPHQQSKNKLTYTQGKKNDQKIRIVNNFPVSIDSF